MQKYNLVISGRCPSTWAAVMGKLSFLDPKLPLVLLVRDAKEVRGPHTAEAIARHWAEKNNVKVTEVVAVSPKTVKRAVFFDNVLSRAQALKYILNGAEVKLYGQLYTFKHPLPCETS